jgi:hypothetical protein
MAISGPGRSTPANATLNMGTAGTFCQRLVRPRGQPEPDGAARSRHSRRLSRLLWSCSTPLAGTSPMPILIFLVLVILIAQVGFWDTFSAILGGVAMIVLFVLLAIALVALAGVLLIRRMR